MTKSLTEQEAANAPYDAKHVYTDPHTADGETCWRCEARRKVAARRGVRYYTGPRHAAPEPTGHTRYEPCVINSEGRCTRFSHNHAEDES